MRLDTKYQMTYTAEVTGVFTAALHFSLSGMSLRCLGDAAQLTAQFPQSRCGCNWSCDRRSRSVVFWQLTPEMPVSIVHYMVNYREPRLARAFAALMGTRRTILARLELEDSASATELAMPFAIKWPAVIREKRR